MCAIEYVSNWASEIMIDNKARAAPHRFVSVFVESRSKPGHLTGGRGRSAGASPRSDPVKVARSSEEQITRQPNHFSGSPLFPAVIEPTTIRT